MAWEDDTRRYASGEKYRLGKWVVGAWHYDATLSRNDKATYAVTCSLPGIRAALGRCETKEAARELLERAVKQWFAGIPADALQSN